MPGPGTYNPSLNHVKDNVNGIKIGTGLRDSKALTSSGDNPGPGNY